MAIIDSYIGLPNFQERHTLRVVGATEDILAAAENYRPEYDRFFRAMISIRELPTRIGQIFSQHRAAVHTPFGIDNFTLMERGRDEIVYGLAGRFWEPNFGLIPICDGPAFVALNEPGIAKLAMNFSVQKHCDETSILSTETRIYCVDTAAHRRFAPYWYLIRPVSGLIRRRVLRTIGKLSAASTSLSTKHLG